MGETCRKFVMERRDRALVVATITMGFKHFRQECLKIQQFADGSGDFQAKNIGEPGNSSLVYKT